MMIGALVFAMLLSAAAPPVGEAPPGEPLKLHIIHFPERRPVDLSFARHDGAPQAELRARVEYRDGQARIQIDYRSMKPAMLFGGEISCYVLWAVSLDGQTENLGELLVRSADDVYRFSTGRKGFALLVTAEAYYLAPRPSSLVMFSNLPSSDRNATTDSFDLSSGAVGPPPARTMDSVAAIRWDASRSVDLAQARKILDYARHRQAEKQAPEAYEEAASVLAEAETVAADSPNSRRVIDLARRSVSLSNVAINIAERRVEALELERQIAERRVEMATLDQRARQAEDDARQSQTLAAELRSEMARLRDEKERIREETGRLAGEKRSLELAMETMRQEKAALELTRRGLLQEKEALSSRLEGALAHVAETRKTARGLVLSLPDILFDLNEATLKAETKITLAKLAGILIILPDLKPAIEGHTDSTGGADFNLKLSARRAETVLQFLVSQDVAAGRLKAVGYGMEKPVADNGTAEGRRRNRRVEVIFGETPG